MNILIVGFGKMGSRHAQSLLKVPGVKIFVNEQSDSNYIDSCVRIGIEVGYFKRVISLEACPRK